MPSYSIRDSFTESKIEIGYTFINTKSIKLNSLDCKSKEKNIQRHQMCSFPDNFLIPTESLANMYAVMYTIFIFKDP